MIQKIIRTLRGQDRHIPELPRGWERIEITIRRGSMTAGQFSAMNRMDRWTPAEKAESDDIALAGRDPLALSEVDRPKEQTLRIERADLPFLQWKRDIAHENIREILRVFPDEDIRVHQFDE